MFKKVLIVLAIALAALPATRNVARADECHATSGYCYHSFQCDLQGLMVIHCNDPNYFFGCDLAGCWDGCQFVNDVCNRIN